MTASVQTKIILPSDGKVYDLTIDHQITKEKKLERTYKCLDQAGATLLDFSCMTITGFALIIERHEIAPGRHSDLAELVAEECHHQGLRGRFIVVVKKEDREPWLPLAMKGFKITQTEKDLDFSFTEDSPVKQKIQDHPMISPALWEHLKKVGDATMKGEVFAEAAPENLVAREAPPSAVDDRPKRPESPPIHVDPLPSPVDVRPKRPESPPIDVDPPLPRDNEPDNEPKGSWIGRAFNYVFCFGWAVNLWNLAFGH